MNKAEKLIQLRIRKLGVLLFDARTSVRRTEDECAQAMGVTIREYQTIEKGLKAPSLPQLEAFAFYLNIPLEHFWGNKSLSQAGQNANPPDSSRLRQIRDRLIGAQLRQKRMQAEIDLKDLSLETAIPEYLIEQYELGEKSIPVPELELLGSTLEIQLVDLLDQNGPIGLWRNDQQAMQKFLELPADLQQFVCKAVNRPYLEVAIHLSELSAEKLRSVAEGLLEITY
jgi:transcriptional regulator with XRE-family HTH domain